MKAKLIFERTKKTYPFEAENLLLLSSNIASFMMDGNGPTKFYDEMLFQYNGDKTPFSSIVTIPIYSKVSMAKEIRHYMERINRKIYDDILKVLDES